MKDEESMISFYFIYVELEFFLFNNSNRRRNYFFFKNLEPKSEYWVLKNHRFYRYQVFKLPCSFCASWWDLRNISSNEKQACTTKKSQRLSELNARDEKIWAVYLQVSGTSTNQNSNFRVNPCPSLAKMCRPVKFNIAKETGTKTGEDVHSVTERYQLPLRPFLHL